ncbi:hypothetical protein DITRI_Ditri13aG0070800 [Diplodiscus trichospermus]
MEDELEVMCNRLTLTEEEDDDAVLIERSWVEEGVQAGKNCLIERLLINKAYNIEAMRTIFTKLWKLKARLVVKKIGKQLFIFQFGDGSDKDKLLVRQPWLFNKALLVLQQFDGMQVPESINMDWCPFWVQIHRLSLGMMSKKIGVVIGKSLGDVEEVDTGYGTVIRVHTNISKLLKRGKNITVEGRQIDDGFSL